MSIRACDVEGSAGGAVRRGLAVVALTAGVAGGCGGGLAPAPGATGVHAAKPAASSADARPAADDAGARRDARRPLGEPTATALDVEIVPVPGARSLLFVSQRADERAAFVRRLDGATGQTGPVLSLLDERVLGAFDGAGDRFTLLTSAGDRLCVAAYPVGADVPASRGCAAIRPVAIAAVGDRLASLEVVVVDPPAPKRDASARPAQAASKPKPASSRAGASRAARPRHAERAVDRKHREVASKHHPSEVARRAPAPRVKVEVRLRWITRDGTFDAEARPTGLAFERPLDGMTLIDAAGRAGGIDLLWYEAVRGKRVRASSLGAADLVWGSLRANGTFDPASRVAVAGGPLEFGWIHGHEAPRLLSTEAGSAVLWQTERERACEAVRVAPSRARLTPDRALCALDPYRLASPELPPAVELAALGRLAAREPRRVAGQPRHDAGLVAWAGDRAYFFEGGALRSAGRDGTEPRDEPAPLPARRQRIAWGAVASDGEGLALADGRLHHLAADGGLRDEPLELPALPEAARGAALGPDPIALTEPELAFADRARLARIGASWWIARGDVVRLGAGPLVVAGLRGRAHPDVSALVGGARRGLFLELSGGAFRVTGLDERGALSALGAPAAGGSDPGAFVSPVRPGFDAAARAGGGALVAGVSRADPAKVVAFAIDEDGRASAPRETSLPVRAGELGVRLRALPDGGALLADLARRHVVWLDDDGRELADAPWPPDASAASCLDGAPARVIVPAPEPGHLLRVPALAEPGLCVVGDVTWAPDGSLRWFGTDAHGADAVVVAGVLRVAPPSPARPTEPRPVVAATLPAPAGSPCPPEMVSIAGRFCVDRFEDALVDAESGRPFSPDWPIAPALVDRVLEAWVTGRERVGDLHARALPLPWLPAWERTGHASPVATSRLAVRPSGYVTGIVAEAACAAAGKRLCTHDEFVTACRGEADTQFPYGDDYQDGVCNVFREDHPAALLHGNASTGHLDPRLNRVPSARGEPLLRLTGATPACRSRWGDDAVYDMVGNLDEWVDEPGGAFAGGFYARSTRSGCDAIVANHPKPYLDYSTGVRCCRDAARAPGQRIAQP
jgi:hypothetical protein